MRGALLRGLARAVDGLGEALAQLAVVVDPGEAEVGEGEPPQPATASSTEQVPARTSARRARGRARPCGSLSCPGVAGRVRDRPIGLPRARRDVHRRGSVHPAGLRRRASCVPLPTIADVLEAVSRRGRPRFRPDRELDRGHRDDHARQAGLRLRPADPARGGARHPPRTCWRNRAPRWATSNGVAVVSRTRSPSAGSSWPTNAPGRRGRGRQLHRRRRPRRRRAPRCRPPRSSHPARGRALRPRVLAEDDRGPPREPDPVRGRGPPGIPAPTGHDRPASCASSARTARAACTRSSGSSRPATST